MCWTTLWLGKLLHELSNVGAAEAAKAANITKAKAAEVEAAEP